MSTSNGAFFMSPEQIKASYPKYAGWNDMAAIQADFNAGNGGQSSPTSNSSSGNSSSGYNPPNYADLARQMLDVQKQANAPVAATLGSQIPTIQQAYQTQGSALTSQIDPLKQRYEAALGALTAGSATDVRTAQLSASREFGARGVPLSSSAYDQYLQNQTLPVQSSYAGQYAQTSGQEAQDVLNLQNQIAALPVAQQTDINNLQAQIANLQAGNPQSVVPQALNLYQAQNQAAQFAPQLALQQQQQAFNQKYITIPNVGVYNVATGQIINQLNGASGAGGGIVVQNGIPYVNIP